MVLIGSICCWQLSCIDAFCHESPREVGGLQPAVYLSNLSAVVFIKFYKVIWRLVFLRVKVGYTLILWLPTCFCVAFLNICYKRRVFLKLICFYLWRQIQRIEYVGLFLVWRQMHCLMSAVLSLPTDHRYPMSIIFPSFSLLVCIKTNLMLIIRMFLLSGGFLLPAFTLCCLILRPWANYYLSLKPWSIIFFSLSCNSYFKRDCMGLIECVYKFKSNLFHFYFFFFVLLY